MPEVKLFFPAGLTETDRRIIHDLLLDEEVVDAVISPNPEDQVLAEYRPSTTEVSVLLLPNIEATGFIIKQLVEALPPYIRAKSR